MHGSCEYYMMDNAKDMIWLILLDQFSNYYFLSEGCIQSNTVAGQCLHPGMVQG